MYYYAVMEFLRKLRRHFWLIVIIGISLLLRLYKLGEMPPSLTNDEVMYIYNAYSVAHTFKDVNGQFAPWITYVMVPYLPVPIYLISFFVGIFDLTIFWGRFANALLGSAEVFLVYLLAFKLFRHRPMALLSALVLAISPWHLHLTRSAYDPPVALFFYLLGIVWLFGKGSLSLTLSGISFFLALFSYRAMNLIFFPILFSCLWYLKKYSVLLTGAAVFLVYLIIVIPHSSYYFNEGKDFDSPLNFTRAEKAINQERLDTLAPPWLAKIFNNKATYSFRLLRENYLQTFSLEYLFTKGEASSIYSLWWRGVMYLIELPLLILGLIFLYRKNSRSFFFVVLMLLVAPLPASLSGPTGPSYVARAFFMLPFLAMGVGAGITWLFIYLRKFSRPVFLTAISLFVLIYLAHVAGYLYQYYARYGLYAAEAWFKSSQDLSYYLIKNKDQKIILANASVFELINYAFYAKSAPDSIQKVYREGKDKVYFSLGKLIMTKDCLKSIPGDAIYIARPGCNTGARAKETIITYNGEVIWKIYR